MLQETLAVKIPIWQNDLKQVLDQNGDSVWFTMPLKDFNALPELEVS